MRKVSRPSLLSLDQNGNKEVFEAPFHVGANGQLQVQVSGDLAKLTANHQVEVQAIAPGTDT